MKEKALNPQGTDSVNAIKSTPKNATLNKIGQCIMLTKKAKLAQVQQERRENAATKPRIYTREQWVRFNAGRNRVESSGVNKSEQARNLEQDSMPQEMPLYTSPPTLLLLEIHPNPMLICVECLKAMWHTSKQQEQLILRCFCQTMHSITYEAIYNKNPKSEMIIEHCDGQLAAIQELIE